MICSFAEFPETLRVTGNWLVEYHAGLPVGSLPKLLHGWLTECNAGLPIG